MHRAIRHFTLNGSKYTVRPSGIVPWGNGAKAVEEVEGEGGVWRVYFP
jgi:hypothetical protein